MATMTLLQVYGPWDDLGRTWSQETRSWNAVTLSWDDLVTTWDEALQPWSASVTGGSRRSVAVNQEQRTIAVRRSH